MPDTKARILETALTLFAQDGYEAVPVSRIAGALSLTKGALYRHFTDKRDIFNCIVARMEALDAERADAFSLPERSYAEDAAGYAAVPLARLRAYCCGQFDYWTADSFAAPFRRLLTLEQFRSEDMAALYRQYLSAGPVGYMADLFRALGLSGEPEGLALAFYGPMYLSISLYDGAADKNAVRAAAITHIDGFFAKLEGV